MSRHSSAGSLAHAGSTGSLSSLNGPSTTFDRIDDLRSVSDLTHLINQPPSDYSYFDKLRMHDLPRSLRHLANHLSATGLETPGSSQQLQDQPGAQTAVPRQATARPKRDAPILDLCVALDRAKFGKLSRKAVYLCDKTIEKRSERPCRIETERQCDYNSRDIFQAFIKLTPVSKTSRHLPLEQQFSHYNRCCCCLNRQRYSVMPSR
jgi:hypothetical protein